MNLFNNDKALSSPPEIPDLPEHIEVVGLYRGNSCNHIVVLCTTCREDPELFGEGLFVTTKAHLSSGKIPCGCSKNPKWNQSQQVIRLQRKLQKTPYSLLNISEPYAGQYTKVTLYCPEHGTWESQITTVINNIGCRGCATTATTIMKLERNTPRLINEFMSTGVFHPGTTFTRIDRRNTQGARNYWSVYCPVCDSSGECATSDLKRGNRPCKCFTNQKYAYINLILDQSNKDFPVAIKFGITSNFKDRLYRQNLKSIYKFTNLGIWEFPDSQVCKRVELLIKNSITCGVISEQEVRDGYTETTYTYNLDTIISLYEEYGGVRL